MDKQQEIFEMAKDLGVPGPSARRLADISTGYEQLASEAILRVSEIPTDPGQSRYLQFKTAIEDGIRAAHQEKKAREEDERHEERVKDYERGRAKGIVPTKEQLEEMVLKAYNSGEILEMTPRNIPKELREDPEALRAKLLEWGAKGAALVKDMVTAAKDSPPNDDDIPF